MTHILVGYVGSYGKEIIVAKKPSRKPKKNEQTSEKVGSTAAKLLRNPKTPKKVKSVAASALTQRPDKGKRKSKS